MSSDQTRTLIADFRKDHPEFGDSEFSEHPKYGIVMTTAATNAFIEWSIKKGHSTPAAGERARFMMRKALAENRGVT